jgi:hypothetical protein
MKASEAKPKIKFISRMNIWQAKWACLSYRSLEGVTRVQQNNNWLLL